MRIKTPFIFRAAAVRAGLFCTILLALASCSRTASVLPLPPAAVEALRKGKLAVGEQQWVVALRYFNEAQAAAPGLPEPLYNLGLTEAQMPGRELRAICWFRAYLALAPDAPNAADVRGKIEQLDIRAEGHANEILALLRKFIAQRDPEGKGRSVINAMELELGQPAPPATVPPPDATPTAAERAQAWVGYVQQDLAESFLADFPTQFDGTANGLARAFEEGASWIAKFGEVRRKFPEERCVANIAAAARAAQVAAQFAAWQAANPNWTGADLVARLAAATGIKLARITPGEFTMGDGSDGPPHRVTISRPFFLGTTEVTQAQWTAVMGSNPSTFKGDTLPVEHVSYDDALAFCKKFTERERAGGHLPVGWAFTLPTEAQWEFACRAGTTGDYGGSGKLDEMGWYSSYLGLNTHPVAEKKANAWGLYDMHGNVNEMCCWLFVSSSEEGRYERLISISSVPTTIFSTKDWTTLCLRSTGRVGQLA